MVLAVEVCLQHVRSSKDVSVLWHKAISTLLSTCWSLWVVADQRARQKAEEEEELYRYRARTHQITGEEDEVEREQLESLFPSFDEEFATELDGYELESQTDDSPQESERTDLQDAQVIGITFTAEEMELISSLHLSMYSRHRRHLTHVTSTSPRTRAYHLGSHIARLLEGLPG